MHRRLRIVQLWLGELDELATGPIVQLLLQLVHRLFQLVALALDNDLILLRVAQFGAALFKVNGE